MVNLADVNVKNFNSNFFARITFEHDLLAFTIPPAARNLYHWLLRRVPAGKIQEFDFTDFSAYIAEARGKPYSLSWFRKAINCLHESGVVEIVRRYRGYGYKLIAFHPQQLEGQLAVTSDQLSGEDGSVFEQKTSRNCQEKSKKEGSNADSSVSFFRESLKTTTPPPSSPVVVKNYEQEEESKAKVSEVGPLDGGIRRQGGQGDKEMKDGFSSRASLSSHAPHAPSTPTTPEKENSPPIEKILQQFKELGVTLSPQLCKEVRKASLEVLRNAVKAYKEYKQTNTIKNPIACAIASIKEQWQPTEVTTPATPQFPEELVAWYGKAVANGWVLNRPLESLPKWGDGIRVCVPCADYSDDNFSVDYVNWREAMKMFAGG